MLQFVNILGDIFRVNDKKMRITSDNYPLQAQIHSYMTHACSVFKCDTGFGREFWFNIEVTPVTLLPDNWKKVFEYLSK